MRVYTRCFTSGVSSPRRKICALQKWFAGGGRSRKKGTEAGGLVYLEFKVLPPLS